MKCKICGDKISVLDLIAELNRVCYYCSKALYQEYNDIEVKSRQKEYDKITAKKDLVKKYLEVDRDKNKICNIK